MTIKEIQQYLENPEKPNLHYFPFQVAHVLSDLAAVMLYDIYKRLTGRTKPLIKDGHNWVFDALRVFAENHPYASESGIRKAFLALAKNGLIRIERTGKYNKKGYDGKWWYALTETGEKRAAKWLMRFHPDVAISPDTTKEDGGPLGIPTAVILEHFRQKFHANSGREHVTIEPSELKIPYSAKTIGRHLDTIVANGILERDPEDKDRYRLAADKWKERDEPITVPPSKLLPSVEPGNLGLITAPSGTAKTSLGTFMAVQHALAGSKVMFITVEEPGSNILDRIRAQEFGLPYTELHRDQPDVVRKLNEKIETGSERYSLLGKNLKVVSLRERPLPETILSKIGEYQREGFDPELLFIDQLEFISALEPNPPANDAEIEYVGMDLPLARALSAGFRGQPFKTWVLHQVDGNPRPEFGVRDIAGGKDVADCFDVVLGIGRTNHNELATLVDLRLFSLTPGVSFETVLEADFPHMRFKPKKTGRK